MRTMKVSNERGSALFICISIIAMLSIIGILAVKTSQTETDLSFNKVHSDKAFYIAEAGAKRAVLAIVNDPTWDSGYADIAFCGGVYTVTVEDSTADSTLSDSIRVTATGAINEAFATIEIVMAPDINYPFLHAMFGDDAVDIRNSMYINSYNSDSGSYLGTRIDSGADVGSNGTIDVYNGALVGGDVASSLAGGVTVVNPSDVTGTISDSAPEQTLEEIPQSEYDWAELNNDNLTGMSGSYTYDPATYSLISSGNVVLSSGVYYFSDFTLKNSASLTLAPGAEVTIYVTGSLEVKNSGDINGGGDPVDLLIYTQGDFVLKNSGTFYGVIYGPNSTADLRNSGDFYGAIVANDIVAHNSAQFHYDRSLSSFSRGTSNDFAVVAWKEL
ncbi:MAG: pilus assembly PilX N-terminal domain-containing protein [Candidatus Zixiibacteriota bacterium]